MASFINWLKTWFGASGGQRTRKGAANAAPLMPVGAVLLDVRSQLEFDAGHIDGAVSPPLDWIHLGIARIVPDKMTPLVLYCRSGARSGRARTVLAGLGYHQVTNAGAIRSVASRLQRNVTSRG